MAISDLLTETFLRISPRLRALAQRFSLSDSDTDDALQDAFCRLWGRRDQLDQTLVEGLSIKIVRNLAIDNIRRQLAHTGSGKVDAESLSDSLISEEAEPPDQVLSRVQAIIATRLTPRQKSVLKMRDMQGLEYDEIARLTDSTPEAVRTTLSRARRAVRQIYIEQTSQPPEL